MGGLPGTSALRMAKSPIPRAVDNGSNSDYTRLWPSRLRPRIVVGRLAVEFEVFTAKNVVLAVAEPVSCDRGRWFSPRLIGILAVADGICR